MISICRWLFLILAAALCASSLLTVVRAPTLATWKLAILAGEFGHWLVGACVVAGLCAGFLEAWGGGRGVWLATLALLAAAAVLFARPAFEAVEIGWRLPGAFTRGIGRLPGVAGQPFDWGRLFGGSRSTGGVSVRTLVYGAAGTPEALAMDLYRTEVSGAVPCVVVIHGGGWDGGSRGELTELDVRMAAAGYAVAAIDYRLAPAHPWPAQLHDVAGALAYLKSHAAELGIDPGRIVLFGRSAGGQIATAAAYSMNDPSIRGVVAFYSPHDLLFAWQYARPDDVLNSLLLLRQYCGGTPATRPEIYASASGIGLVGPRTPPTLLVHGTLDTLVWYRQSERLDARLTACGVPHVFLSLPWATHAFEFNLDGPGGQLAWWCLEEFLAAETR